MMPRVFATVYNGVNEFKCGHTSIKGPHRLIRPVELSNPEPEIIV